MAVTKKPFSEDETRMFMQHVVMDESLYVKVKWIGQHKPR